MVSFIPAQQDQAVDKTKTLLKMWRTLLDNRENSICNNPECKHSMKICPKCGRPLRLREGRFGKFGDAQGYGVKDDKCSYTTRHRLNSKQT